MVSLNIDGKIKVEPENNFNDVSVVIRKADTDMIDSSEDFEESQNMVEFIFTRGEENIFLRFNIPEIFKIIKFIGE